MAHCQIEHHATLFALLAKEAVTRRGEDGQSAVLEGVFRYGQERGRRMAARALQHGDPLTHLSYHAYGEWRPTSETVEAGIRAYGANYMTFTKVCPWCAAWEKHNLLEYGKLYCLPIDTAVYAGFHKDFSARVLSMLSWGGRECLFDWQQPLEDLSALQQKQQELGDSCIKDFDYHTAHLYNTVSHTLIETLGEDGYAAAKAALETFIELFGQDYADAFAHAYP